MKLSRREFIKASTMAAGGFYLSSTLVGCGGSDSAPAIEVSDSTVDVSFTHGVASGDPLKDRVILWSRVAPTDMATTVPVKWEVATDMGFANIIVMGEGVAKAAHDFTVKVDVSGLDAGQTYYYRFSSNNDTVSSVGTTKTLPMGEVAAANFAVFSCANYPAGHFNAYGLAANKELDAVIHLGDYIYEYGPGGYATGAAEAYGRDFAEGNAKELIELADYRARYAQYRTDTNLQALHAAHPFIVVWDDHEVANDAFKDGAENHNPDNDEGAFSTRKQVAQQAYFEWLPIRPYSAGNNEKIYRKFEYGDLLSLYMLDTRLIARSEGYAYNNYFSATGDFDAQKFIADLGDPNHALLGGEQFRWLTSDLTTSQAKWNILGQQVLMGRMYLPAEIIGLIGKLQGTIDAARASAIAAAQYAAAGDMEAAGAAQQQALALQASAGQIGAALQAKLGELTQLKMRQLQGDPTLTVEEQTRLATKLPYNLDAWDGYEYERAVFYALMRSYNVNNLVVLAGDSHNAWASNLTDSDGTPVGVELATSSVSSPGLEDYLNLNALPLAEVFQFEFAIQTLIDDLQYTNLKDRGYMLLTVTPDEVQAEFVACETIASESTAVNAARSKTVTVASGSNSITV